MASNFIDYVKILFRSGNGGNGSVHFRREKFVDKGGPDGGDGGRGGHIILKGNAQLWTLLHLKYQKHIYAEHGQSGAGARKTGADGQDIIIEVPIGTVAKKADDESFIMEITEDGEEKILMEGGKGGLGNFHFKSPTNQTPRKATPGKQVEEMWIQLELKLLADVGLVGFPNAGKSTLLSVISAARPKIADYPFTTLKPNLGVVSYRDYQSFVVADIPGIIEGASEGKGLGWRFLRHIERNAVLLFMVSGVSESVMSDYQTLLDELKKYNKELMYKKRLLAITKSDLIDEEKENKIRKEIPASVPYLFISSATHDNIAILKDRIWELIQSEND